MNRSVLFWSLATLVNSALAAGCAAHSGVFAGVGSAAAAIVCAVFAGTAWKS